MAELKALAKDACAQEDAAAVRALDPAADSAADAAAAGA
jgi:hypothetical protein